MRSASLSLHVVCWLLIVISTDGAEPKVREPATPQSLVGKTVTWQAHWDNRAGVPTMVPSSVTFQMHDESEVWISGLDWLVTFVYRDNQPFPHFVQRLPVAPDEVRERVLQPFARLAKLTAKVPLYTNCFRKITTLKADSRETLLIAFKHEAASADMLAFYKDQTGHPIEKVRFWIAPVDLDFPVILYIVDGLPYIGKVNFHTRSFKPLYLDFDYIGDPDTEPHNKGLKLMSGIKAEGDQFELRDGRLIRVAR
jgi:hypothetical protein